MKRVWLTVVLLSAFICIDAAQADMTLPSDQARIKKENQARKSLIGYWPKPFQAKFVSTDRHGVSQFQEYSNGKGLLRTDSENGYWIYNFANGQETYVDKDRKTSRTYGGSALTAFDAESARRKGGEPIGERTVNGHHCHGFKFSGGGASTWYVNESWFGDDTGCLVLSSTKTRMDDSSVKLLEYKAGAPDASVFAIPAGYKSE